MEHGLVHLYNGRTDVFTKEQGLSGDIVSCLFEDREGNVWVATTGGIDRFREFAVTTISSKEGLASDAVVSVAGDRDGSIWIGTSQGLTRWASGQPATFRKANGLPGDSVESLFQDDAGRLWLYAAGELAYFNGNRVISLPRALPSEEVHSITGDIQGNLWLAGNEGLYRIRAGHVVEKLPWPALGASERAKVIVADRGGVWVSFWGTRTVSYFKDGALRALYKTSDGLGKGRIADLQLDGEGALWVATEEGGLSRIKDGHIATLTTANGLPCDSIHVSIEDDDRSLWLYTACGLVRITRSELNAWIADPRYRVVTAVLDAADGVRLRALSPSSFSPVAARSRDGKLWFVTGDSVQVVDPRHLPYNDLPPPVHIERIVADHKTYWQRLTGAGSSNVRLPPRIRDLWIDYTAVSLVAPEKIRFKYKLEGQDSEWREVVNDREVQYSNLAPKHYRFRVIASNNSGVWNETGDSLEFIIPPAWYQTMWFRGACVAVFLLLLWGIYQLRVQELRAQERKFREAVENMPALAFVADTQGNRPFVNRGWLDYTGFTAEEAKGSGWQEAIHPDDLKRVLEKWHAAQSTAQLLEYESRIRRGSDGAYRWFQTRARPLFDRRGKLVKWCGVATDIEDRKRAEEELRRNETWLGETQALAHTGSFVWDVYTGQALYLSNEWYRVFGFAPGEENAWAERWKRVHPEDRSGWQTAVGRAIGEKCDYRLEERLILPDGTIRNVRVIGHPVLDASGDVVQFMGSVTDITERKRAEQLQADLAHVNRVSTMEELAASIAHELKQPFTGTLVNASASLGWLEREPPRTKEASNAIRRIVESGERAMEIIDHLQALYKKAPPKREPVVVNEIIGEMVGLLRGEATRHAVSIRADLAEDLPAVVADQVQIQQVLMNLMLNGIEAMKDTGGVLTVKSASGKDGQVLISISDTGVCLPDGKAEQIFDAFFTTKPQGSGMGLAISRSIVESHGGRLWATANNGRGAEFHFTLPVAIEG
ncbi:MAG: PAS domain S-box protein [Silvibacterium sp.]|nr:PAS domain S-box protein [Silvibacterium sp.]